METVHDEKDLHDFCSWIEGVLNDIEASFKNHNHTEYTLKDLVQHCSLWRNHVDDIARVLRKLLAISDTSYFYVITSITEFLRCNPASQRDLKTFFSKWGRHVKTNLLTFVAKKNNLDDMNYTSRNCMVFIGMDVYYYMTEKMNVANYEIIIPWPLSFKQCVHCKVHKAKMPKCAGCLHTRYCSVECQHNDWKRHKSECKKKNKKWSLVLLRPI